MKNLEDCLKFGLTHKFRAINFDVVSIQNAQFQIDELCHDCPLEVCETFKENALQYITKWESDKLIHSYYSNKDYITIIPNDVEKYDSYTGGVNHYTLYFTDNSEKIIA